MLFRSLWALEQSDNIKIKNASEVKFEKKYSNTSSYSKFSGIYNVIDFEFFKGKYKLRLNMKDETNKTYFKTFRNISWFFKNSCKIFS